MSREPEAMRLPSMCREPDYTDDDIRCATFSDGNVVPALGAAVEWMREQAIVVADITVSMDDFDHYVTVYYWEKP